MNSPVPPSNEAAEKHKTLRLAMVLGVGLLLAVLGMNVVVKGTGQGGQGKVDVDFKSGKFSLSLDRPVLDQIGVRSQKAEGGTGGATDFTQGKIDNASQVAAVAALDTDPTRFSGKNFINEEAGFLFTVNHPEIWQIRHERAGMTNPLIPVNTIYDAQGTHLNVTMETVPPGTTIHAYVQAAVGALQNAGMLSQAPEVTYDAASQTAFAVFTNAATAGQSYMKVVLEPRLNRVYIATANYNAYISNPTSLEDLRTMISRFTVIAKS